MSVLTWGCDMGHVTLWLSTTHPATGRGAGKSCRHSDDQGARAEHDEGTAVMYPADVTNSLVRAVQVLAQHVHDLQAHLAVLAEEPRQLFSAHEYDLRIVQQLRRDLVRGIGKGRAQTQC